jgi:hypothetical protein
VVRAGALKAILGAYGGLSAAHPLVTVPGPASEERLWAEAAAWLKKTSTDADRFAKAQNLGKVPPLKSKPGRSTNILDSLVKLEQAFDEATVNALSIAALLPYHLHKYKMLLSRRARSKSSRPDK